MSANNYLVAILISASLHMGAATPIVRHDSPKCPFCQMPLVSDTTAMDFRVTLTANGKSQAYRCVLCAVADAKGRAGNIEIDAASEKKGHPIRMTRESGKWSISPETSVFAYAEGDHEQCETRYRVLTSQEAFKPYVDSNPKILRNAKLVSLAQFLKLAG